EVGQAQSYLTLPQTAITYNPYGEFVFVATTPDQLSDAAKSQAAAAQSAKGERADKQLVAKQVFVKVGPTRGDQVAILSGIKPGEQVVTSGQLKLKNGTPIKINNAVLPSNNPAPAPHEQ